MPYLGRLPRAVVCVCAYVRLSACVCVSLCLCAHFVSLSLWQCIEYTECVLVGLGALVHDRPTCKIASVFGPCRREKVVMSNYNSLSSARPA